MRPFARQLDHLVTIPGVGRTVAEVIIAETGGDMTRFPPAGHLASWVGVCPGRAQTTTAPRTGPSSCRTAAESSRSVRT
ncbi:transposase [Frankia sp. CcI49]|uniref:transposase n=1 Tax=Frankia sp. CcI49 TaxID=1745382 RepID=UPI0018E9D49A|nr:transposase [Frankia sp. CcI49]